MPDPATVFLATALGLGTSAEAPPGLVEPSPAVSGHVELGVDLRRVVSVALAASLGRSWYDNTVPPPDSVSAGEHVVLSRAAIGVVVEGRLPRGRIAPALGGGVYAQRARAKAEGSVLGVRGDYFEESDGSLALEARGGLDVRVARGAELGLRASYSWSRVDLPGLTDGAESLGAVALEARLTLDLTGLRPGPPAH